VEAGLRAWMIEHEYQSVAQLRGSASAANVGDRSAYERANYQQVLHSQPPPPETVPSTIRMGIATSSRKNVVSRLSGRSG